MYFNECQTNMDTNQYFNSNFNILNVVI